MGINPANSAAKLDPIEVWKDNKKFVKWVNQAIQQGYKAIVLSAADQNALAPTLKKAKARGICVVTSDADVTDTNTRVASVLPASSDRIGAAEVGWIAEATGKKGKIAILSAAATAANQNTWIEAMKKQFAKYPGMQLVGVYYGDDDATKSAQQFNQILTEHPDIAGIISPTTVGIRAAAQEKKAKGAKYDTELTAENEQARRRAMERVKANNLVMKLTDAEWQWDRRKLTFFFTAERRVDFLVGE